MGISSLTILAYSVAVYVNDALRLPYGLSGLTKMEFVQKIHTNTY
jgi:hypothetical protein